MILVILDRDGKFIALRRINSLAQYNLFVMATEDEGYMYRLYDLSGDIELISKE